MTLTLALRHPYAARRALEQHALAVSDPDNVDGRYGRHLSGSDVDELMAPPDEQVQRVLRWLGVTHDDTGDDAGNDAGADQVTGTSGVVAKEAAAMTMTMTMAMAMAIASPSWPIARPSPATSSACR